MESRLKDKYDGEVKGFLTDTLEYKSVMQVPKLEKIIVNVSAGEAKENPEVLESTIKSLRAITSQVPLVTQARKSITNFKLRENQEIGCKVALRGQGMYDFLDKLVNVTPPWARDFRGASKAAFDGRGNYFLGIREQLIFPEIEYDGVDALHGMNVVIVTTAKTNEEARVFLEKVGMPFTKE